MSSPPEACFCGRPRSGDSAWFCSDECARRDSLNTLLGLPSLPRTDSAGHTTVTEPPALPTSTVADRSSTSSGRKGHYRVVEAQRAAQRRSDIIERAKSRPFKQASAAHDRKSSLSSSASRASTLFSNPDTAHSSGSSLSRSPHMLASHDRTRLVEDDDDDAFATCLDDWGALGDSSSIDDGKPQLSARQMSAMQQRTVAELFEEIARARKLSPWASKEFSSASDVLDGDASVDSETDLDPLNDDALAPFMNVQPPKSVPRTAVAPALPEDAPAAPAPVHVSLPITPLVSISPDVDARQTAIEREQHPALPRRGIHPSTFAYSSPPTSRSHRSAHNLHSAMPALPVRQPAPRTSPPVLSRPDQLSFLPAEDNEAASRHQPDKSRSSLLRLPLSLGRGLSRAGGKLRSRMSALPLARPVVPVQRCPAPSAVPTPPSPILEPAPTAVILEMEITASTSTILSSSSPRTAPSSPPVASSSTVSNAMRDSRRSIPRAKSFHEAHNSVLGDANASYLLLRVPKLPPRAGAFPSTPSPFRSPATDFSPSPTPSLPSSSRDSSTSSPMLRPTSLHRSTDDLARPYADSPTIEFYRDRPLPPVPAPPLRADRERGMLRPAQVLAMRAQSQTHVLAQRPLRRAESQSTVTCRTSTAPPRIVVHPYAAGVSDEYSADESEGEADAAIDVLPRLRTNTSGSRHGLGLGVVSSHRMPMGVVDSL